MVNIHWLGTGLSAIPGLKMLIENGHSVIVYNRTVEKALEALRKVYKITRGKIPLVGVGGISNGEDAYERIRNGATLIEIYTVLIYEGPSVVARIKRELEVLLKRDGFAKITDAVGVDVKLEDS